MANCDNLFKEFDARIKLSSTKKDALRVSRNALREKVREKFYQEGYETKFHWQGSFAMDTIIAPKDDDYDVDDGIYIQGETEPQEKIDVLHRWVVEAAQGHTDQPPEDKNTCVRVFFKSGYHVDLVIYHKKVNDYPKLAHKSKGWIYSDPKQFMDWFNKKKDSDGQLKRIVRYFKAWADNLRGEMPSGLIFTILATNNFRFDERDDIAFLTTLKAVQSSLNLMFVCYRPTLPHEDLFSDYSDTRKSYILARLESFVKSGEQAMNEVNQKDACAKWQRHFGDRFPCDLAEDTIDNAKTFETPAFIRSDARSA